MTWLTCIVTVQGMGRYSKSDLYDIEEPHLNKFTPTPTDLNSSRADSLPR